ncbi:hypothetical protein DSO57_1001628 [Entomophthora muscae]|uniref:Uncharacterized protein n=1 Tax=Entomophthora muscae TaxID=34485 RepID=A0ACC2S044_9FUNG|nr:hypothetical protein DSO57_1001628 [Entomophthora muscae]
MKCSLIFLGFLFSKTGISSPTTDLDKWSIDMKDMLSKIKDGQQDITSRRKAWNERYQLAKKQMDEILAEQAEINKAQDIVNQIITSTTKRSRIVLSNVPA